MKIFIKTWLVALVALVINCSKSSGPAISIAGTWSVTTQASTGCTTAGNNYTDTFACPATANNSCLKITFSSSGSFTSTYSYVSNGSTNTTTDSGTYSISGNRITITSTGGAPETDTFVLSGNTMTITTPKDTSSGCIDTIVLTK